MAYNILGFLTAVSPPPAIIAWFTFLFVLVRLGVIIKDYVKEKIAVRNSINDAFWYREVIIPYCLEPLKEFIISQSNDFLLLTDLSTKDDYKEYLNKFKKEQGAVIRKTIVTGAVNQNISPFVNKKLERLEDDIVWYCARKAINYESERNLDKTDIETKFHQTFCDIVKEFRVKHHMLFK